MGLWGVLIFVSPSLPEFSCICPYIQAPSSSVSSSGAHSPSQWNSPTSNTSNSDQAGEVPWVSFILSSSTVDSNELAGEPDSPLCVDFLVVPPEASSSEILGGVMKLLTGSPRGYLLIGSKRLSRCLTMKNGTPSTILPGGFEAIVSLGTSAHWTAHL